MDKSRLDAAIALYMRCEGYTIQEVAGELTDTAPAAPTAKAVTKESPMDTGRSGMPLVRREILILPTPGPRRSKFRASPDRPGRWNAKRRCKTGPRFVRAEPENPAAKRFPKTDRGMN